MSSIMTDAMFRTLRFAHGHLRRQLADLKLHADFLDLRRLLLEARCQGLDLLMLLRQVELQFSDSGFLFLNFAVLYPNLLVLFQELVEQHRVHCFVADGVNLVLIVTHHEVRVHFGYFFGNQSKLRHARVILLVVESDRPERKDGFTGFVHRLNFFLEPARGTKRAELARGVDQDWYGVGVCCCRPANVADKATVAHVRTIRADSNNVTSPEDAEAGPSAQGRVAATGGVILERTSAVRRVVAAGGVVKERNITVGSVAAAGGVAIERLNTVGRVVAADSVVRERHSSVGCVAEADGVRRQCARTEGTVGRAAGVAK